MRIRIAMLAAFLTSGAQANELGRLFHTSEQRTQKDMEYAQRIGQAADTPKLNGMVQRNDGSRTLWLDGLARHTDGLEPLPAKVGQRLPNGKSP